IVVRPRPCREVLRRPVGSFFLVDLSSSSRRTGAAGPLRPILAEILVSRGFDVTGQASTSAQLLSPPRRRITRCRPRHRHAVDPPRRRPAGGRADPCPHPNVGLLVLSHYAETFYG